VKTKLFFTSIFACVIALSATLTARLWSQSSPASASWPAVSPLGAPNNLPDPYRPGVSWGQLPNGRKWGSTAGIAIGLDGNIWAIDRCGAFGSRGTNCADSPLDPILQFDPSR